jgi:hypothetical protein
LELFLIQSTAAYNIEYQVPKGLRNTMKLFFKDHTPCLSFMDLDHFKSHATFFKDIRGINVMDYDNLCSDNESNSKYYTIEQDSEQDTAAYLTPCGERAVTSLCKFTTAYGRFRKGDDDEGVLDEMKVESTEDDTGTIMERVPPYNVYQAVNTDNTPATVLDAESNFRQIPLSDEVTIFEGASQSPVVVQVSASMAIISLFLHGGFSKVEGLASGHSVVPRNFCQLEMNTRPMTQTYRLYDTRAVAADEAAIAQERATAMSDAAGLVVTAQGRGRVGNNFSVVPIYITPFKVELAEDAPEGSAPVTSIENVMDMPRSLEGDPRGIIITTREVLDLWEVLFPEIDFLQQVLKENTTHSGTEAYATKAFSLLLATMQHVFGGLKTCADWSKLYARLSQSKLIEGYSFLRVKKSLSWPERNYMVYEMMAAVTELRVSLLDGLGRACATKLACMSRIPQVTMEDMDNPKDTFVNNGSPKFNVVGKAVTVECIALNQGTVLDSESVSMCRAFSKGILFRVNQTTNTGFADLLNEFLDHARHEGQRKKYWLGASDEEMGEIMDNRRLAAYKIICDHSSNNNHLTTLQQSTKKTENAMIDRLTSMSLGANSAYGVCQAKSNTGHEVMSWLVCLLTSTFAFATLDPPGGNTGSRAHSQMMIFVRSNGITPVPKETTEELLYQGVATSFKVCQQICAVNYSRPFCFLRILSNNVHFLPFVGRDSYPVVKRCMGNIVTMHILM